MYLKKSHLHGHLAGPRMAHAKGVLITAGISGVTALSLGAMVGYRHEKGVEDKKLMPALGPFPMDAMLAVAGLGLGTLGPARFSGITGGIGIGALNFFAAGAGQALGVKLAKKMAKTSGVPGTRATTPPSLESQTAYKQFLEAARQAEPVVKTNEPVWARNGQ